MKKKILMIGAFVLAALLGVVFWQMMPRTPQPMETPVLAPEASSSPDAPLVQPPSPEQSPLFPSLEVSPSPSEGQTQSGSSEQAPLVTSPESVDPTSVGREDHEAAGLAKPENRSGKESSKKNQSRGMKATKTERSSGAMNKEKSEKEKVVEEKVIEVCRQIHFTHKFHASHEEEDACLFHRNQIVLTLDRPLSKPSVCVRHNHQPIPFEITPKNEITFGPGPNLRSEITVQYCTGKSVCSESCAIAKDRFLEAIGGEESDETEGVFITAKKKGSRWGNGKNGFTKSEALLEKNLNEIGKETKEDEKQMTVFKEWIQKSESAFCEGKMKTRR